jgi:hypothetical protein
VRASAGASTIAPSVNTVKTTSSSTNVNAATPGQFALSPQ